MESKPLTQTAIRDCHEYLCKTGSIQSLALIILICYTRDITDYILLFFLYSSKLVLSTDFVSPNDNAPRTSSGFQITFRSTLIRRFSTHIIKCRIWTRVAIHIF